ncbi:DUF7546 family protein [Haloglomus litoreum]|uniref:DUF7546 family protein n=1 Tax=Haloglomus litoreum TaxID=3034026 RepID=UPI0023E8A435|nr:hypothetical protein [Haloglomus sp. DT116]
MSTRSLEFRPGSEEWWLASLLAAELLALVGYFGLTDAGITSPRYILYPLVWITVGVWAVLRASPPVASERARWIAGGIAAGYVLLLAFLTGLLAIYVSNGGAASGGHSHVHGLQLTMTAPGWGPRISYVTHAFHVYFVPFRWIGYLALGYLLYATLLDATSAALSGVVGVATCLSCAFPLVASVMGGLGGAAVVGGLATYSLDLSTAAFLVAVGLLLWRPEYGRVSPS